MSGRKTFRATKRLRGRSRARYTIDIPPGRSRGRCCTDRPALFAAREPISHALAPGISIRRRQPLGYTRLADTFRGPMRTCVVTPASLPAPPRNGQPAACRGDGPAFGQPLCAVTMRRFADGEIFVKIDENVRGAGRLPSSSSTNRRGKLHELLLLMDASRPRTFSSILRRSRRRNRRIVTAHSGCHNAGPFLGKRPVGRSREEAAAGCVTTTGPASGPESSRQAACSQGLPRRMLMPELEVTDWLPRLQKSAGDRYSIDREIGVADSIVYLARDLPRNRFVALKVFRPDIADRPRSRPLSRRNPGCRRLAHPHICRCSTSDVADGPCFTRCRMSKAECCDSG